MNCESVELPPLKKQRVRSANFSLSENEVLQSAVKDRFEIITAKHCNSSSGVTKKIQDLAWENICSRVNSVGTAPRTVREVKDKWRNLTKQAKADLTQQKISAIKTGGGPPLAPMKPLMEDIAGMYADSASFHGIPGASDSETMTYSFVPDKDGILPGAEKLLWYTDKQTLTPCEDVNASTENTASENTENTYSENTAASEHTTKSTPSTTCTISSATAASNPIPSRSTNIINTATETTPAKTVKCKKTPKELQVEYYTLAIQLEKEQLKQTMAFTNMLPKICTALDVFIKHFGEE